MARHLSSLTLVTFFSATAGSLFCSLPAAAVPLCYTGHTVSTTGGPIIGCLFFDPNWGSGQASMCNGNTILHSTGNGACHVCVPNTYVQNIQNGSWSIFSVSGQQSADFRCLSCATPPQGLVGWWAFDEKEPGLAFEARDIDLIGEHVNGVTPTPHGRFAYALQFDGVNDYVEVLDHPSLNFGTGDFTVDAWVQVGPSDVAGIRTLLDKRVSSPTYRGYSFFLYNGRPGIQLADGNGYSNYVAGPAVPADGLWHLVTISVSRTGGANFYIDQNRVTGPVSVAQRPGFLDNSSNLRIGSRSFEVTGLFRGRLDEVEIFNRALAATDIQALFRGKCKPHP